MGRIYTLSLRDRLAPDRAERLWRLLPPQRVERALRCRFERDRDRCLFGGLLVRYLTRAALGSAGEKVAIATGSHGKPYLQDVPGQYFSLSHSGDWVVCGWDSRELGVDVEAMDRVDLGVARRVFTEEERRVLAALPDEGARRDYFYSLWVLKESYIKYRAEGMAIPLRSFGIDLRGGAPVLRTADGEQPPLHLALLPLDNRHKLGYCGETPVQPEVIPLTLGGIWDAFFSGEADRQP